MAADHKRQATAGKIATPKVAGGKDVIDSDSILYKAVGARIRITVAPHNTVLEGTLFTTCNITNAIAINTTPAPPNPSAALSSLPGDYHIIPFAHILNIELLGAGERVEGSVAGFDGALPSIAKVDLDAVRLREETTIKEIKKRDAMKGKGVSREAQEIFDAIAKTLTVEWHGTDIVVNEAVIISKPYTLDDCKAPKDQQQKTLPYVKKILENFFAKKRAATGPQQGQQTQGQGQNPRVSVAMPIAPRKGG